MKTIKQLKDTLAVGDIFVNANGIVFTRLTTTVMATFHFDSELTLTHTFTDSRLNNKPVDEIDPIFLINKNK